MKNKGNMIEIIQGNGKVVYQGVISDLPIREDYIIEKSIELFNEKEPCIIYRTHIMKKFYIKLYEALNSLKSSEIACSQLDEYVLNIDLELQDASIRFFPCNEQPQK